MVKSQGTLANAGNKHPMNVFIYNIIKDFDRNTKPWTIMYAAGINNQQTPTEYITVCFVLYSMRLGFFELLHF